MTCYRTVFISDTHLGFHGARTKDLLTFLNSIKCEKLYLVGDIIDLWVLNSWNEDCNKVVKKLINMSIKGTKVIYVPGNHDEYLRKICDSAFANIALKKSDVHSGANGRTYLVTHGDQFDFVYNNMKWLSKLGSHAYDISIYLNEFLDRIRRLLSMPYWSLSSWLKHSVKGAVSFIGDYERYLVDYAKSRRVDGVICGHIHHPNIRNIDGIEYLNCGDWVETCSAIVEHHDGRWELIYHHGKKNPNSHGCVAPSDKRRSDGA